MPPACQRVGVTGTPIQVASLFSDGDVAEVVVTGAAGFTAKFSHQVSPFFAMGANSTQTKYLISDIMRDFMWHRRCQVVLGKFCEQVRVVADFSLPIPYTVHARDPSLDIKTYRNGSKISVIQGLGANNVFPGNAYHFILSSTIDRLYHSCIIQYLPGKQAHKIERQVYYQRFRWADKGFNRG